MALEYNQAIDAAISAQLTARGVVGLRDVSGATEAEAAQLLATYVELHRASRPLEFDGRALRSLPTEPPAVVTAPSAAGSVSPVDQVLATAAGGGGALLDAPRGEPAVSKFMWLLPLGFALPGGILAWVLTREQSPRTARSLFWVGVIVTIISVCLSAALVPTMASVLGGMVPRNGDSGSATWSVSQSGNPTFYYFGTTT